MKRIKEWFESLRKENKKLLSNVLFLIGIGTLLIVLGDTVFVGIPQSLSKKQDKYIAIEEEPKEMNMCFESQMEERIEEIFSKMEGAGKVKVMITVSYGKESFFAEDVSSTYSYTMEEDTEGGQREIKNEDVQSKIVMQNTGSGSTEPVILKEKHPIVEGIVIIAEGGENPIIKEKLTAASQALLGVPAHKVQVFKMNNK
ncbi:MAG: hypothetical protein GX308_02295 [Epulopiscium sp.]|nr:hypothetical protein [Candidatus Epulonipiscium sp.]